jgi:SpoVK/Ycf46/Vps4 family AAA+-type ATPase
VVTRVGVVENVLRDIEKLGPEAAETGLAATALAVAQRLDDPGTSSTSVSMCSKSLIDVLRELRALAPPKIQEDRVDEIAQRRAYRVGGAGA